MVVALAITLQRSGAFPDRFGAVKVPKVGQQLSKTTKEIEVGQIFYVANERETGGRLENLRSERADHGTPKECNMMYT